MKLSAHTDGASKGNPGDAAIGFTIEKDDVTLEEHCEYIGQATNNVAEYRACIAALDRMRELGATDVVIHSDSELLVKQINGLYRVKNPGLIPLYSEVMKSAGGFTSFTARHVPRGENSTADGLANTAIRNHRRKKPAV